MMRAMSILTARAAVDTVTDPALLTATTATGRALHPFALTNGITPVPRPQGTSAVRLVRDSTLTVRVARLRQEITGDRVKDLAPMEFRHGS